MPMWGIPTLKALQEHSRHQYIKSGANHALDLTNDSVMLTHCSRPPDAAYNTAYFLYCAPTEMPLDA